MGGKRTHRKKTCMTQKRCNNRRHTRRIRSTRSTR